MLHISCRLVRSSLPPNLGTRSMSRLVFSWTTCNSVVTICYQSTNRMVPVDDTSMAQLWNLCLLIWSRWQYTTNLYDTWSECCGNSEWDCGGAGICVHVWEAEWESSGSLYIFRMVGFSPDCSVLCSLSDEKKERETGRKWMSCLLPPYQKEGYIVAGRAIPELARHSMTHTIVKVSEHQRTACPMKLLVELNSEIHIFLRKNLPRNNLHDFPIVNFH